MGEPIALPIQVWDNAPPLAPRRERLWEKHGRKCHWCSKATQLHPKLPNGQPDYEAWDMATIDHILPRYKQGTNDEDNLVSACRLCNSRRNHEDALGLPEGALLGTYMPGKRKQYTRIALTADDKRKIGNGQYAKALPAKTVEEVLREQRDQAVKEVLALRSQLARSQQVRADLDRRLKTITVRELVVMRAIRFLRRFAGKYATE